MSNSIISSLDFATSQTYIYMGIGLIIGGVVGGIFNIIVFLSLRIYRQSSSAFYLTIVSIVNTGQLLTGLLSRVLVNVVGTDWTESSLIFCKLRYFLFQACGIISPTYLCLVTIDQFITTSTHPRWQRWNNIKTAHYLSLASTILWLLYGIPYLIYYTPTISATTGLTSCTISNPLYIKYYNSVHIPVFMCAIPLCLTVIFGLLAYRNVRRLSHQTVPIVRRRHEVQLTIMVLVQVIFNTIATTPSFIVRTIVSNTTLTTDPIIAAHMRFVIALTTCIYYLYYTAPFYIYICVSNRFRKQLRYVMIDIYLNRYRRMRANRVLPQTQLVLTNENQHITVENIELVQ